MHLRRHYVEARARALAEGRTASASVFLGLRDAVPGTALPSDFPHRAALAAARYACLEDLGDPASDPYPDDAARQLCVELRAAGLRGSDALEVVAAL